MISACYSKRLFVDALDKLLDSVDDFLVKRVLLDRFRSRILNLLYSIFNLLDNSGLLLGSFSSLSLSSGGSFLSVLLDSLFSGLDFSSRSSSRRLGVGDSSLSLVLNRFNRGLIKKLARNRSN